MNARHDMPLVHPEEPTAREEAEAEDFAITVEREAGCPSERCPSLTICEPCGGLVCAEHTVGVGTCVEVGEHHGDCFAGCEHCQDVRAREQAEELAWAARSERGCE